MQGRVRFERVLDVRHAALDTWFVTLHRPCVVEKVKNMVVRKIGQLVADSSKIPNLRELMEKSFVITRMEYVQAGDYDRLILTVNLPDGSSAQYGTFSDSIKQKVKRFVEPELLKDDTVAVKLIEVTTKAGRKAMTFTDADEGVFDVQQSITE